MNAVIQVIVVIIGIILLLPGLCSLYLNLMMLQDGAGMFFETFPVTLIGWVPAAIGAFILWAAFKKPKPKARDASPPDENEDG